MPVKKRGLFNLSTPLQDVPRLWLRDIEPKIVRLDGCWLWMGTVDRNGYPIMTWLDPVTKQRESIMVHRYVANIFWDFLDKDQVRHTCEARNCLNPHHLFIRESKHA